MTGKMVVHRDARLPFPVLANDTYAASMEAYRQSMKQDLMPSDNSHKRFVKACRMVDHLKVADTKQPLTQYAFNILDEVSQGQFTKWSIVYDIINKKFHFKTADADTVKSVSLSAFNFDCNKTPLMFNMNQAGSGDISATFILPDKTLQAAVINKAVEESRDYVTISDAERKLLLEYAAEVRCR